MRFPNSLQAFPSERDAALGDDTQWLAGDIRDFVSRTGLEKASTSEERTRLAHELHDGLLQSLTGLALQLQAVSRLLDTDFDAARRRLNELQSLMAAEQRELRAWITNLSAPEVMEKNGELVAALQKVCRRAEWQWRFSCEFVMNATASIPQTLGDHIYRIVQEGLNNAGRHARAQRVRIATVVRPDRIDIELEDDGVGFPFHGEYDLARLTAFDIGPRSLKERVGSLGGSLLLTTGLSGSRLQITLPQTVQASPVPRPLVASD